MIRMQTILFTAIFLLILSGCEKNGNPVDSEVSDSNDVTDSDSDGNEKSDENHDADLEEINAPAEFDLSSPEDGSTNIDLKPLLKWQSSENASHYSLKVSKNSTFTELVIDDFWIDGTDYQVEKDLSMNTVYFWQVSAVNKGGEKLCTKSFSFTTKTGIHFVKNDANGKNNGTDWENAFNDIQDAINTAQTGHQIWVAAGTYKPTSGTDRTISFTMKENIEIYGGFNGSEKTVDERNWTVNETILSGEIGDAEDPSDNSYHVVVGEDNALLDGFVITGGNANGGEDETHCGGGLFAWYTDPAIKNCIFKDNLADIGAGICSMESENEITNCSFVNNHADNAGGGIYHRGSAWGEYLIIDKCVFEGNSANEGGGIHNNNNILIKNSIFYSNSGFDGGGILSYFGSPTISNCIFSKNSATFGAAISNCSENMNVINSTISGNSIYNNNVLSNNIGKMNIENSIIWGNTNNIGLVDTGNDGTTIITYSCLEEEFEGDGNHVVDPLLVDISNPKGEDGIWMTPDDGFNLMSDSPCIDSANGQAAPELDILGNKRYDHLEKENSGINSPDFADIGTYEFVL